MSALFLPLPGNEAMAAALAARTGGTVGSLVVHRFPDQETSVRIVDPVQGRDVALVCTLHHPDTKFLPLAFTAATARALGARRVGLVAPYLAYMRQDAAFTDGEGVTSLHFASLLSRTVDWLVTVDPHLHRHANLAALYDIPAVAVHAAPAIASYLRAHVPRGVVIGPDGESAQWVHAVADAAALPVLVLAKRRNGDRDVVVSAPRTRARNGRVPIIVDDIVSSGRTVVAVAKQLRETGSPPPVCVAVHPVFSDEAEREVRAAGVAEIVSCNSIPHATNAIDIAPVLAPAIIQLVSP